MENVERKEGVVKSEAAPSPKTGRYDHKYEPGAYGVCRRCGDEWHDAPGVTRDMTRFERDEIREKMRDDAMRELVEAARRLANDAGRYLAAYPQQGWIDPADVEAIRAVLAKLEGSR